MVRYGTAMTTTHFTTKCLLLARRLQNGSSLALGSPSSMRRHSLLPLPSRNTRIIILTCRRCFASRLPNQEQSHRGSATTTTNQEVQEKEGASSSKSYLDEVIASGGRPMTVRERVLRFPKAILLLYYHCKRNQDIVDASCTKLNAWTINHPLRRRYRKFYKDDTSQKGNDAAAREQSQDSSNPFHIYQDEGTPGRIPRRQFEQHRRVRNDLSVVLPVVMLYAIPVVGYIPMVLAIIAPRQVLSHQFHNEFEKVYFPMLEYNQRRDEFPDLMEAFWKMTSTTHKPETILQRCDNPQHEQNDAAGPWIEGLQFHSVFANLSGASHLYHLRRGVLSSVEIIPREYLTRLALAVGIHQSFPPPLNRWVTRLAPSIWLRYRVRQVAHDVSHDDHLLLLEEYHKDGCVRMTALEVLHACLIRNLPIDCSVDEMRRCLTNHLKMIDEVKRGIPPGVLTEGFGVFTLHLVILRDYFKRVQTK